MAALDIWRSTDRETTMQGVQSTLDLVCCECGTHADEQASGWRTYLAGGYEGEPVEVVVLCPSCAAREFDARSEKRSWTSRRNEQRDPHGSTLAVMGLLNRDARRRSWQEIRGAIAREETETRTYEEAFRRALSRGLLPEFPERVSDAITSLAVRLIPEASLNWWIESLGTAWVNAFWATMMQSWDDTAAAKLGDCVREDLGSSAYPGIAGWERPAQIAFLAMLDDSPFSNVRAYLDTRQSWVAVEGLRDPSVSDAVTAMPNAVSSAIDDRFERLSDAQKLVWTETLRTSFEIGRASAVPCLLGEVRGVPSFLR